MKTKALIFTLLITAITIYSCKKESDLPVAGNQIELGQTITDSVGYFFVDVSSALTSTGGNEIKQHGHCWSTDSKPTVDDYKSSLGKLDSDKEFSSQLSDLKDNTNYHIRSYVTYTHGTVYGTEQNIKTLKTGKPVVSTNEVNNVTLHAAQFSGVVLADSGLSVTARGVIWDTISNFTIDNCLDTTIVGNGKGSFTGNLTGLTEGITYYLKAYATNQKGTSYGEAIQFSTAGITVPEIISINPTEITAKTAKAGGDVTGDGNGTVISRGICWSTSDNTTLENNLGKTTDGSGTGSFISEIVGLEENTNYFVRAYATNEKGTNYGTVKQFSTLSISLPEVGTMDITGITLNSANSGGNVTSDGNETVTARGVCWSTSANPTLSDSYTTDDSGTGTFISNISGLEANTKYYVRAYAANGKGTTYANEINFTTLSSVILPTVTTDETTNIAQTTATSGGNVTSDGGAAVSARGVCWNTAPNPTLTNNHSTNGTGAGTFVSNIIGLTTETKYYVRAYATNSEGTTYGNEVTFTALPDPVLPAVTTEEASNITQTTANSGGNVTSDGGAAVTARGVCWSAQQNPDLEDSHTIDGTGTGNFSSLITGLSPNTNYYIKAYATNSVGTTYGSQQSFITSENPTTATVTTANTTDITQTTATTGGTVHADGGATVTARGVCYSTSSEPTLSDNYTTNGNGLGTYVSNLTGLAPKTQYYVRSYATNSEGTAYGNEMTFITLSNLTLPTVTTDDATDITQTTATGGGNVTSDGGTDVTERGVCWSTDPNPTLTDNFMINGSGTGAFESNITGLSGNTWYYVRAYATNSEGTVYGNEITFTTLLELPTITTDNISDTTQTTATSGGNVTSDGGASVTERGVCWSTNPDPTLSDNYTTDGTGTGTFVSSITGLTENTIYYVRAYATNSVGTTYGNEMTFTTTEASSFQCGDQITYEGQVYNTVEIGTQCWMKENLNIGVRINGTQTMQNNQVIEKYCFNDTEANCDTYGGIYQWDEMMQYTGEEGAQGICPYDWHISTDDDWTTLNDLLGGTLVAGGKMKETGIIHWISPNEGATNESGFTGLPGGNCYPGGGFSNFSGFGFWWSATESSSTSASYLWLSTFQTDLLNSNGGKENGFSVRCVKD